MGLDGAHNETVSGGAPRRIMKINLTALYWIVPFFDV